MPSLSSLIRHGHFFILVVPQMSEETTEQIRISVPTLDIGGVNDIVEMLDN